jgi:hypothetical protein
LALTLNKIRTDRRLILLDDFNICIRKEKYALLKKAITEDVLL